MIRGDEAWGLVRKRMGHKRESGHGGKATRGTGVSGLGVEEGEPQKDTWLGYVIWYLRHYK